MISLGVARTFGPRLRTSAFGTICVVLVLSLQAEKQAVRHLRGRPEIINGAVSQPRLDWTLGFGPQRWWLLLVLGTDELGIPLHCSRRGHCQVPLATRL